MVRRFSHNVICINLFPSYVRLIFMLFFIGRCSSDNCQGMTIHFIACSYVHSTPGLSFCPTPDCTFVFEYVKGRCREFTCPVCECSYCLDCLQKAHGEIACASAQSKEQRDFEGYVKRQGWRKCKLCGVWVERADGCDNVTCR